MDAVQLRCRELANASVDAIQKKLPDCNDMLTIKQECAVQARIETLLREIATGQTILKPNRRQLAEGKPPKRGILQWLMQRIS